MFATALALAAVLTFAGMFSSRFLGVRQGLECDACMAGRVRGISTSGHRPGDRGASDYGFGWFHVSMSFRPLFGCLVSFVTPQM
jgi:hypothetical protein